MLPVPFTVGIIDLDGAPTTFTHYIAETNPEKLTVGMQVKAVFKPKRLRQGNIFDIVNFEIIGSHQSIETR